MLTFAALMLRKPLIAKNKALARALLYGVPLLLIGVAVLIVRLAPKIDLDLGWRKLPFEEMEAVQYFRDYIQIDTSPTTGNEIPGAELLARILEAEGIPVHLERLGDRNANLWAVLEGRDPKALVLHNHIDVDPIRYPDQWRYPPFGGIIELPWIYGRGAFDMKSVAIAQLMAMLDLKRRGQPLERSVIFLATGTEETESVLGTRWILSQHEELVERFGVVLTEGGAVEAVSPKEVAYWGTENLQKRYVEIRACHGSRRRLEDLRRDLLELRARSDERILLEPVAEFFRRYAPTRKLGLYRELLADPEALLEGDSFYKLPTYLRSMMLNEVEAFPVVEDPGGGYSMRLILTLLPGTRVDEAWDKLLPEALTFGVPITYDAPHGEAAASPEGHPLFATISGLLEERYPGVESGPLIVPRSATDARFFRAAGIPAYGFSPFLILSTDTLQMTGPGERMILPAFIDGVELYQELVRRWVS